jgi:hypothetical protein
LRSCILARFQEEADRVVVVGVGYENPVVTSSKVLRIKY